MIRFESAKMVPSDWLFAPRVFLESSDGILVLRETPAEDMTSVVSGDKIKIVFFGGIEGGFKRILPWIADRTGRQSLVEIRVVGRSQF